jgi:hypothetical protein
VALTRISFARPGSPPGSANRTTASGVESNGILPRAAIAPTRETASESDLAVSSTFDARIAMARIGNGPNSDAGALARFVRKASSVFLLPGS